MFCSSSFALKAVEKAAYHSDIPADSAFFSANYGGYLLRRKFRLVFAIDYYIVVPVCKTDFDP